MRMQTTRTLPRLLVALVLFFVCAQTVVGQEEKETRDDWRTESFRTQHVNVQKLRQLFGNLPGSLRHDEELGILVVHAPPQTMSFIQETIAELDVPARRPTNPANVEITAYLLGASRQTFEHSEMISTLQPVVKELRERFPYQGYRLLESTVLRARSHSGGEASGVIPGFLPAQAGANPATYRLEVDLKAILPRSGKSTVSLGGIRLSMRVPIVTSPEGAERLQFYYQEIGINTDLDIPEGETVVVGKAGVQGAADGIFLILQANVVD